MMQSINRFRNLSVAVATALTALSMSCSACTDFVLKSQDNAFVAGRSLEFGQILPTQVKLFPRNENVQTVAPNNQKGMNWTSKYAYAGMAIFPQDLVIDGQNEKGLSVGILWFPDSVYPDVSKAAPSSVMGFTDLSRWLLGNFASVAEAKAALAKINIFAYVIPELGPTAPGVHFSIHDAKGNSLVLEFLNGEARLFDNPSSVLTNSPELPWHLTNLRNFINLSAVNAGKQSLDGTVLQPSGQGTGLLGIPGDWTPPSRFVRAAIFKQAIAVPKDAKATVNAAFHLLNTVDIPYGAVRGTQNSEFDFTQWVVVKDLTNNKLYVRTYDNQNIQVVDLNSNFPAVGAQPRKIALVGPSDE